MMTTRPRWCASLVAAGFLAFVVGCSREAVQPPPIDRPNVLWIVWDTVRADHLSLYGYERETTPNLASFAETATVFANCVSVASTTVPSHVSMFTGLFPDEHGLHNERPVLADDALTIAEQARDAGYRTYLFSENPFISNDYRTAQGFEVVEHPWEPKYVEDAVRITAAKIGETERVDRLVAAAREGRVNPRRVKAAGELAQRGLEQWLDTTDAKQPFFAVINYMEAHHPLVPPRDFRERFLSPVDVARSFELDRSWEKCWDYALGISDWTEDELRLHAATYDAAIAELDALFGTLIESLRAAGRLKNTIVIVVADHGEHLGEKHLLDHQFSVYEPLMRVPLVVFAPQALKPGRDDRPVSTIDLYPTLSRLCGLAADRAMIPSPLTFDLSEAPANRARVGACPAPMLAVLRDAKRRHPSFSMAAWRRSIHAYYDGPWKLIVGSDGRMELYDLEQDPQELTDLSEPNPPEADRLRATFEDWRRSLRQRNSAGDADSLTPQQRARLKAVGYLPGASDDDDADDSP